MKRPVVLTFIGYFAPGFKSGGPVQTIKNMMDSLGHEFEFRVVTRDRDVLDDSAYADVEVSRWTTFNSGFVYYLPPRELKLVTFKKIISETPHHLVYLNSYFDPVFTLLPLIARLGLRASDRRFLIAPRGECATGALSVKRFKKQFYRLVTNRIGLYSNLDWHASTLLEAQDIQRELGALARRIHVAPDLPRSIYQQSQCPARRTRSVEALKMCMIARIVPVKNIIFAIEVLRRVSLPARLDIFGPKEDAAYWRTCAAAVSTLPAHIQVNFRGAVSADKIPSVLSEFDLFFLPTMGENFGHSIVEAFQAGLPVLISDRTPWRGLATRGVGADLSLDDPLAFVAYIESVAGMPQIEVAAMQRRIFAYASEITFNATAQASNREMLRNLTSAARS